MIWWKWFLQVWPTPARRSPVLEGYRTLGLQLKPTLTDIGLRNHVFAATPAASNLYEAGIAEGRRRCALEIFTLANIDLDQLWELVEKKSQTQTENRT